MATLDIPDSLYDRLKAEAQQSHAGDVVALVESGLSFWSRLTNPLMLPLSFEGNVDPRPDLTVLQQMMSERVVSVDTVAALGRTFTEAGGRLYEGRRHAAADYLSPYLSWVGQDPPSRALNATVLSVQASAGEPGDQRPGVVAFATGYLQGNGITVKGDLRQTFSDRTSAAGQGFDVTHTDDLGMELTVSPENNGFVDLTLIAKSWGGARQTLRDGEELGGILVARGDSVGSQVPEAVYALTLSTFRIPG